MENIKEFMELAKEEFIRMMPDGLAENIEIDEATVTKMNDQVASRTCSQDQRTRKSAPTMNTWTKTYQEISCPVRIP